MKSKLLAAVLAVASIGAVVATTPSLAQTTMTKPPKVLPPGQPRSELEKDATTRNGEAQAYGKPENDPTSQPPAPGDAKKARPAKRKRVPAASAPAGDLPTYPAPAKDGTPTR